MSEVGKEFANRYGPACRGVDILVNIKKYIISFI